MQLLRQLFVRLARFAGLFGRRAEALPRAPTVEALEPRILYSADPLALYAQTVEVRLLEPETTPPVQPATHRLELIFIDSRVGDVAAWRDAFAAGGDGGTRIEVITVDSDSGGLAQVGAALAGRSDVAAVRIVSHGAQGTLLLGSQVVDNATLEREAASLTRWQAALGEQADILLYGCDVAEGEPGALFIQTLARLSGADVAASTNATGGAMHGGDTTLEARTGSIEAATPAASALSADVSPLATYVVTNTNDSGAGSLRQAITDANANAGADTITFNIAGTGVHTINVLSTLTVDGSVTIDATTDDSFAANSNRPAIILDGNNFFTGDGLVLTTNADGSTIRGFVIRDFTGNGVEIQTGSDNNTIAGNYIGSLSATGANVAGEGNTANGILVRGANNTIGGITAADRNVLSGNTQGIQITGAGGTGNTIIGNYVGTDATGLLDVGNTDDGIEFDVGAGGNIVGGMTAAERNVISGNNDDGFSTETTGNVVHGNYIGVGADGTTSLANTSDGVEIWGNATGNQIGGTAAGQGNLIANNGGDGIFVSLVSGTPSGNSLLGNSISSNGNLGIDLGVSGVTGNDAAPDSDGGANNLQNFPVLTSASANAAGTTIVGSLTSAYNTTYRIEFFANRPSIADSPNGEGERYLGFVDVTTNGSGVGTINTTLGNVWINAGDRVTATATNLTTNETSEFTANVTATSTGIVVVDTTSDVSDGTTTSITNLGAARGADGRISLREAITAANNTANGGAPDRIVFNIAGTGIHTITVGATALPTINQALIIDGWSEPDYAGTPRIELNGNNAGTSREGLMLAAGSSGSTIRGLIINRFTGHGIELSGSSNHVIEGNWIGLASTGLAASANAEHGIHGFNSSGNLIGGTTVAARNVISGNSQQGIFFDNVDSSTIAGNYVGTDVNGTGDVNGSVANTFMSGVVLVSGSSGNVIGGTTAASRNVLSGNNHFGFEVIGTTVQNNLLQGNYIGTDVTGLVALGNINGGAVFWNAGTGNVFGGNVAGARNVIAGNTFNGIVVGSASTGAVIEGNYIGVGADGVTDLGNGSSGVKVEGGSTGTRIGTNADGSNDAAEGNVISGNTYGVRITDSGSTGTVVAGNTIGLAADGDTVVANSSYGVSVSASAANTTIGGATSVSRNIISGNAGFGVYFDSTTSGNSVLSNYIGTNAAGTAARANLDGVWIDGGDNNTIGQSGAGNLISGNTYYGVVVDGAAASGNVIRANLIGTDAAGTGDLGNGAQGILVSNGASSTSIGGTTAGQGNTIAFNDGDGIHVSSGTGVAILGNAIHSNTDLGIDLDANGVTANDAPANMDSDSGANNLQNFAVLTIARTNGANQLTLSGTLNSNANSYYRIEFFANTAQDASGYGEGQTYLGFVDVGTDASGNATISTTLTANVAVGTLISATATRSNITYTGFTDTSEFARNIAAVSSTQATVTVTTATDNIDGDVTSISTLLANMGADGFISLREAITAANNTVNGSSADRITFNIAGTGVHTINVATALPTITGTVILDASTDDSFAANGSAPAIVLDGNDLAADGLVLSSTADGSTIRGLVMRDFGGDGIEILAGSDGNTIAGNYLGRLDTNGADAGAGEANAGAGLAVSGANNTIGGTSAADRNVISGNASHGVFIINATATGNVVQGNYVGIDAAGTSAVGNAVHGVVLSGGASNNLIGGASAEARNVISGNAFAGVRLAVASTSGNTIQGNFIGVDVTGAVALGNGTFGVITDSQNTTIGGTAVGARNVISGNASHGVHVDDEGTGSVIQGNYIGTDVTGTLDLGNGGAGVYLNATTNVLIGGGARNVISGNTNAGIYVNAGSGHTIQGNYIGVDVSGSVDLGNDWHGVLVNNAAGNLIGGTSAAERNVISGNAAYGIAIAGASATGNTVSANYIGLNAAGTAAIGNVFGVDIEGGATSNTIGGLTAGARNVISGNTDSGVLIQHAGTSGNQVLGNYIGTNAAGSAAVANLLSGVNIKNGATNNTIGGTVDDAGNLISGNGGPGVVFSTAGTTGNTVLRNSVYGNTGLGIDIDGNGVTTNDAGDGDSGVNNLQNFPVLTTALTNASNQLILTGTLNSNASSYYRIEFFASTSGDGTGYGEGQTYLGFANVATDGSGNATISTTLSVNVAAASFISATATRATDNTYTALTDTSEFAQNVVATIAPVVTTTGTPLAYSENAAAAAVDGGLTVSDADSTNLAGATISISANFASGQDVLAFTDQNGITGSWNAGTGVLTLTGTASVANYQTALRSVTYVNTSDNPSTTTRTVSFVVNDGAANSNAGTRNISIAAVNDAPVVAATGTTLAYTENGAATAIDTGLTVSDADNANLASATVTISTGFATAEDTLAFTNQNGITGSWNSGTGVLTLTGSATVAQYQTALRSITYVNISDNPSTTTRTVGFVVNDGSANSNTGTRNISVAAVNDAPVVTTTGTTLAYTENGAATTVDSALTVSDADNANLSSATVTISAGFATAEDTLAFTNQNGITGSWNSGTGVLTLTGSATVAQYQTALRSITYVNTSDNPSTTTRTVSFVINDGAANSSTGTRNISIAAVNDAPVVTTTGTTLAYTENGAATTVDSALTVSDADNVNLSSATVTISAGFATAEDTLAFTNQNGITGSWNSGTGVLTLTGSATVAQYQTALRSITYVNTSDNPSTTTRTVSFVVNDGSANSNTGTRDISVAAVNDAPVLTTTGTTLAYTENGAATAVDGALTLSDADSTNLASATVTISAGFATGEDTLAFTTQNGITGSWNSSTGVMTLSGSATVAQYQAALRSITYVNTSDNPSTTTRTVSFVVNDGSANSNTGTRDIAVSAVNDAPVNTVPGAQTVNEDTALAFTGANAISVADIEGNLATTQLTVGNGTLAVNLAGGATISAGANSSATLTLAGTQAQINAALATLTYQGSSNFNGSDTLTVLSTDANAATDSDTVAITVSAVNDAPFNTVPGAQSVNEDSVLAFTGGNTISVADVEGNLATTQLTVGNGMLVVNLAGGATISAGANSSATLTLAGTQAQINAALTTLTYQGDPNFNGADTLTVLSTDASAATDSDTVAITVSALNDVPVVTTAGSTLAYAENAAATAVDNGLAVSDVDSANLASATVTISAGFATAEDTLAFTNQNGISGTWNSSTGVLTLTGSATVAQYQTALRSITYVNSSDTPSTATRTVSFVVNDGVANSNASTRDISVAAVNDAPINTVPGAQTVNEDTALAFTGGSTISVADAEGNLATTQLTVGNGTLAVNLVGGATISAGANSSATLTLVGTQAQINAALATLTYQGTSNFNGSDTLTVLSTDSNSASDSDTVAITVSAVNDAPINTVPGAQTVNEDVTLAFTGGNNISVADAEGNLATTQLTVGNGTLNVNLAGGATINAGANSSATLTLAGTQAQINAALATLTYQGGANFNGSDTLTVLSTDANSATDSDTVAITVSAVNDAPLNAVPGAQTVNEDTALAFTGGNTISVADAEGNLATTQITVGNGTLAVDLFGGATISAGANSSATLTLAGTQAQINAALATLTYQGTPSFNGADTLTVLSTDSNSATDSDTVAITVSALNDAPVVTTTGSTLAYAENAAATAVDPGLAVADVDSANLAGATVAVSAGFVAGEDTLAFADQNGITGSWNASTGVLTLSGSATVAQYQAALRSITYVNTADNPSTTTRTVSFVVNDGSANSNTGTRDIAVSAVNDAPVNTVPGAQTVNEDTALAFTGANAISVADVEGNLATTRLTVGNGTLAVNLAGGATISAGANSSATLTLAGTQAQINAALATLTYQGSSNFNGSDTLTVLSTDGSAATDSDTVAITVSALNDAPVVTTTGSTLAYEENAAATAVDPGLAVADVDSANLAGATVAISAGFVSGEDTLAFTDQNGITGSWSAGTGVLTLSGSATVSQYQAALRSITYVNSSDNPSTATRTVRFVVNDASANSNTGTRDISVAAVNDAPVLATTGTTLAYAENGAATAVDGALTVSDADNANLAGATVTISSGFATGEDTLAFSNQNGITGSWNSGTGVLTLSGSATVAQYQAALRSITYLNSSENPSTATRTVTFVVNDGAANSNTGSRNISVAAVNDAPTGGVTIDDATPTQGQTLTASNTLADADGLGAISHQWQRGGVDIVGATGATYTTSQADVGSVLRVVASYTDGQGTVESVASADTAAVANVNDASTGGVAIDNTTPTQGQTLTASNTLADIDGLGAISYQWQRGGVDIAGATGTTYVTTQADVGAVLRVVASYTDGRGTVESVASADTAAVANVNDAPMGLDATVVMDEDATRVLGRGDFGFIDPDSGDALGAVRIDLVPGADTLRLDGVAVSAGTVVDAAALDAGRLAFVPAPDASGSPYATLDFTVRDAAGLFAAAPARLTFVVAPLPDAPQIDLPAAPATATVDEGAPAGMWVTVVHAVDADPGDTLTYSLDNDAAGRFVIDAQSGHVAVAAGAVFDPETAPQWLVTVRATDGSGLFATRAIQINVNGVPQPPAPAPEPAPAPAPAPIAETPAAPPPASPASPSAAAATAEAAPVAGTEPQPSSQPQDDDRTARALSQRSEPRPVAIGIDSADDVVHDRAQAFVPPNSGAARRDADAAVTPETGRERAAFEFAGLVGLDLPAPVFEFAAADGYTGSMRPLIDPGALRRAVDIESVGETASSVAQERSEGRDELNLTAGDAARATGVTVTAGFLWWLTRGGGLLTMMLAGIPAWRHMDMLPVLARQLDEEAAPGDAADEDDAEDGGADDHLLPEAGLGDLFAAAGPPASLANEHR